VKLSPALPEEGNLLQNPREQGRNFIPKGKFMTKWPSEAPKSMINPQIIH
jgi:hypothetical protein